MQTWYGKVICGNLNNTYAMKKATAEICYHCCETTES